MRRLQDKVRDFMKAEQHLTNKLNEVEKKDQSLMDKLESALSFGKVMFLMKPVTAQSTKGLLKELTKSFKTELEAQNLIFLKESAKKNNVASWGI
jgi:hypothetical protein